MHLHLTESSAVPGMQTTAEAERAYWLNREQAAVKAPAEIDVHAFHDALGLMYPMNWRSSENGECETFMLAEMICGNVTEIYARIGISGCLSLSGPTFASSKGPVLIHSELPEQILAEPHAVPELVTTNVLLRQILAEVIKTNSLKEDKRCSDGEKNYSPGYIISVGNKTLRCDIAKDYPQWIEGDKA